MLKDHDNVEEAEVAQFEKLAHRWWDPEGDFKPLHSMNPVRANFIDQTSPVAHKKIIDIGSGGGLLTETLKSFGAVEVTGIDMGKKAIEVARLHALESNLDIDYRQTSPEAMAEEAPEHYEIVTCLELLEHVPDPASVIAACGQLCAPGGDLYFSTINRNPKAWLLAILGAEYVLKLLPQGTHQYEKFIKPAELCRWLRQSELQLRSVKGMIYNPVAKTFSLSDTDTSVNYLVHAYKAPYP